MFALQLSTFKHGTLARAYSWNCLFISRCEIKCPKKLALAEPCLRPALKQGSKLGELGGNY